MLGPAHVLRRTGDLTRRVDRLAERHPRTGLAGVLADLDTDAEPCPVPGAAAGNGFTWSPHDRDDRGWWPQGVAVLRGGAVLLVSWYAAGRTAVSAGSRLTVVDRRDPARPRYRHVALAAPVPGLRRPRLAPVRVHAGGIAVVGDVLHVADTVGGLRVFHLDDVLGTPSGPVLVQHHRLRAAVRRDLLRWSFVAVADVGGARRLVAGEYRRAGGAPRLVEYPLDPSTGLPALDARGRWQPVAVHERQPPRMQGVAVHDRTWYLSASSGEGNPGDLYVGAPGAWQRHRGVLPTGCEDLDWAVPGEQLWCATEWPGRRWLFPVDVRPWSGPVSAPATPAG